MPKPEITIIIQSKSKLSIPGLTPIRKNSLLHICKVVKRKSEGKRQLDRYTGCRTFCPLPIARICAIEFNESIVNIFYNRPIHHLPYENIQRNKSAIHNNF